jgi:hypothetical protein
MAEKRAWRAWLVAVLCGALSLYGWAFFLMVGPSHGPGLELGVLAGVIALIAVRVARARR